MEDRTIIVENLSKAYRDGPLAVDGINLRVEAGEMFGFLGPNGAGKSTTVAILATLSLPTGGRAWVGGWDVATHPEQVRRAAGVALQEIGIDPIMTPVELLRLQGRLFGLSSREAARRATDLLDLVDLREAADRQAGKLSGGMRRRLDLALALVHNPSILFLDEPTTGLDPASRRDIWAEVRRLNREQGMTVFLTTQYLEEADALAQRVAIINQGRIAAEGAPAALKAALGSESINVSFGTRDQAERARRTLEQAAPKAQIDGDVLRLYLPGAAGAVPGIVAALNQADLSPLALTLSQPTLDDVFLQVTGQRFQAGAEEAAQSEARIA